MPTAQNVPLCDKVTNTVRTTLPSMVEDGDGGFRDGCIGIEVLFKQLTQLNVFCLDFELEFTKDGVLFTALDVTEVKPDDLDYEGMWKIIFSVCAPKMAPNVVGHLRVVRATFRHRRNPIVEYVQGKDEQHESKADLPGA